jgi:hypothetical protein
VIKIENAENCPSGAKAQRIFSGFSGTAEAVPFQSMIFIMDGEQ